VASWEGTVAEESITERDPVATARDARAANYFDRELNRQREWYSQKAGLLKKRSQALAMFIIAAGAGTAFFQIFGPHWSVSILTALLGAMISIAEGWQRVARYDETWRAYRVASERMKYERRLYVYGAGEYKDFAGKEDAAFLRFFERIEAIIAEEQQIYWQGREAEQKAAEPAPAASSAPALRVAGGRSDGE
jgi:hypothetical protein